MVLTMMSRQSKFGQLTLRLLLSVNISFLFEEFVHRQTTTTAATQQSSTVDGPMTGIGGTTKSGVLNGWDHAGLINSG